MKSGKNKLVIGFGYKRRTGKDLAGDFAEKTLNELGMTTTREAFAKPLKEGIGKVVFALTDTQLYGNTEEKTTIDPFWNLSPRTILQRAGTDAMRHVFGGGIWAKALIRRCQDINSSIIVTDVRFPEEAEAIRILNGILVRCHRNVGYSPTEDGHPSETALDNYVGWDYVLNNNGSVYDLAKQVQEIVYNELKK